LILPEKHLFMRVKKLSTPYELRRIGAFQKAITSLIFYNSTLRVSSNESLVAFNSPLTQTHNLL
jgi:hypothetical protein